MATTADFPLSTEDALALWKRLLDENDRTASSEFAVSYLNPLAEWLTRNHPDADPHDCDTAAENTILALTKNPASYKPERQTLHAYLRMSAARDLKNVLRSEQRHTERRADFEVVELSPAMRKYLRDDDADPAIIVERREDLMAAQSKVRSLSADVLEGLTPAEARALELMQLGERKTSVYARVLGLSDRPPDEQQRDVKRVKDKLKKRLERARDRHA
jgi:DNA-directed RNA polymerase specialized sigma24 family protein